MRSRVHSPPVSLPPEQTHATVSCKIRLDQLFVLHSRHLQMDVHAQDELYISYHALELHVTIKGP